MTVRTESGTEEQPVPDSLQKVPVLSDEQAAQLTRYGIEIEELYGMPMDIEWTLADGEFAIVQARPVTAMPEAPLEWPLPDPKGTYMRTSIADLMPEPLSPLFVTMGIPTLRRSDEPAGETGDRRKPGFGAVLLHQYQHLRLHELQISGQGLVLDPVPHAAGLPAPDPWPCAALAG